MKTLIYMWCVMLLGCASGDESEPSCTDQVQNSSETDVDCGGPCVPCKDGMACATPLDCVSSSCQNSTCQPPTCTDGIANGGEVATDCGGGGTCPTCGLCSICATSPDCSTGLCDQNLCAPTITVISAIYAANCGAATPIATIPAACNGKQSCNYVFNYVQDLGTDPAYGCYKDLKIEYTCTGSMTTKTFYESCAPCDPQNTPTQITLALDCAPCVGEGTPPI